MQNRDRMVWLGSFACTLLVISGCCVFAGVAVSTGPLVSVEGVRPGAEVSVGPGSMTWWPCYDLGFRARRTCATYAGEMGELRVRVSTSSGTTCSSRDGYIIRSNVVLVRLDGDRAAVICVDEHCGEARPLASCDAE